MGAKSVIQKGDWVEICFTDTPDVNVTGLMSLRSQAPSRVKITAGPPQMISVKKATPAGESFGNWLLAVFRQIDPAVSP